MKKFLFPILIIVFVLIFFWQFLLKGLIPIPADTIVGLYYPFRDFYSKDYPRGIPFKNFMITDPVRQQYPWKYLVIEQEKRGEIPTWNPYTFSGAPLLANLQSGAFYPLNIIFFLTSFSYGWGIFILLQPLLAAIFLFYYLKNLKIDKRASLFGSISFAFSGFFISWLEWGTVIHTALWLPLILLSIDKIFKSLENKFNKTLVKWLLVLVFSIVSSFLAGHLQIFFYEILLTGLYTLGKIINSRKKLNTFVSLLIAGLLICLLSIIQLLPSLRYIFMSARGLDQDWHTIAGWFLPWQNLVQIAVPDFFGNPATLNYWGIWNYGEFISYIGILGFIFALFSIFRKDKKTIFFIVMLVLSLIFSLPTIFAKIPYKLNFPLISTSQPTRLIFLVDFSLSILAAFGFDYFLKVQKKIKMILVLVFCWVIFISLWAYIFFVLKNTSTQDFLVTRQNLIFSSILLLFSSVAIIPLILIKNKNFQKPFSFILIIFLFLDLLRLCWKYTPFTNKNYLYPQTNTISFLKNNLGNYRIMASDSRIFPPNFSIMYKFQTIDGYDPLYLQRYGELMAATGRDSANINPPFGFNRIITMQDYHDNLISLLGIKYVLSLDNITDINFVKVFSEGDTKIYENKKVLPRSFFIRSLSTAKSNQEEIDFLFKYKNELISNAIINTDQKLPGEWSWYKSKAEIINYGDNNVRIETENKGDGFMVLTDTYYPTWHATIDGKETKIYLTDYNFRGVVVPKGKHMVEFYDSLF